MTFTYNVATAIGQMRMLIPDRVATDPVYTDEELTALLSMEGGSVKRATAQALESIASDQVMVLKVISNNGLTTNGAAVSTAILARAAKLREQADIEDSANDAGFDIAEQVVNEFSYRERTWNELLRGQ